jgi:drug/metabolite transporter (DMT)-like permease
VIVFFRLVLASLFLAPFTLSRYRDELRRLTRRDLLLIGVAGVLFAIQFLALFESFAQTSILIAGAFSGSIPLWAALLERFVLRTRLNRLVWVGLLIAIAGGVVTALAGMEGGLGAGPNPVLGSMLALTTALCAAFSLIIARSVRSRTALLPYIWLVFSTAAIVAVLAVLITGEQVAGYSAEGYLWVILLTIFPQLIAHGSFNYVVAYLSATFISVSGQVVTVISAIAAFLVFTEIPTTLQIIGSAIIISGVILVNLGQQRLRRRG